MKSQIIHSKYSTKIVLEIRTWENGVELSRDIDNKKSSNQKIFQYQGRNISLELLNLNNMPVWLLILDEKLDKKWLLQEYLWDLYTKGMDLPSGGLVFVDEASRDLISTNLDIGETEEWFDILEKLKTTKAVTHTFSATDDAIELKVIVDDVSLQNLSWEAMPDRLVSSRDISPLHLFKKQNKFENEIKDCLNKFDTILDEAKNMDQGIRNFIFKYFSVKYRRQSRQEDSSPN